jgi:integrase
LVTDKKWIKGTGGMYIKKPTRGARAGETCYWARVWIKSRKDFAHFFLGLTPKQAERKMREILGDPEAALAKREEERAVVLSFGQVMDLFLANYHSRGSTGYYHDVLKAPRAFMEDMLVSDINPETVDRYLQQRRDLRTKGTVRMLDGKKIVIGAGRRKVSESTLRKELIALGTMFKWAKRKGYVHSNPADAESMPRPTETFDPQAIRWLTDDELANLRSVSAPWLRNVIGWATETGMDKGKIRRLRWQELDLDRADGRIAAGRFAMQRDKTGKPIRQELSDGAVAVLNRAGKVRHAFGVVFLDASGQLIEEKVLDWALGRVYEAAGIKGCNFRTFRHTFATRALRRGIPREVVAKMMGHSTAFITERYMHVADDQLKAAAKALSGPERLGGNNQASTDRDRIADAAGAGSATAPPTVPPAATREAGVA